MTAWLSLLLVGMLTEGWSGISVNEVAADELELSGEDTLKLSPYSYSDDGELISDSANVTISSIISMDGKGSIERYKISCNIHFTRICADFAIKGIEGQHDSGFHSMMM